VELQVAIKYSGLYINPNDYSKKECGWLILKVEKRLAVWCNKWLSRGGHLILVKEVIKAIYLQ